MAAAGASPPPPIWRTTWCSKGLPFRQAHEVIGRLVRHCLEEGKDFSDLTLKDLKGFSPLFDEDALAIDVMTSVQARDVPGGTAPNRVSEAIAEGHGLLSASEAWIAALP